MATGWISMAAAELLKSGVSAVAKGASSEKDKVGATFKAIASYPFKVLASLVFAPILLVGIAWRVKELARRVVALVGLLAGAVLSYLAGTFLGSWAGALFVSSQIGFLTGIGFLLGTTSSNIFSVIFQIVVFNSVCYIFVKLSNQEVVDYLRSVISGGD